MKITASLLLVAFAACAQASPDKNGPTVQHPAMSPAGTEVAFSADFDGAARIWIGSLDGRGFRRISAAASGVSTQTDHEPSWSPDGRRIAYASSTGSGSEIWVMQADGTYPQRITFLGAASTSPVWSPNGQKIAFVSDKDGTKDIWTVNADGSGAAKLLVSQGEENRPRYSPSGNQLVFSRTDGDKAALAIVNADGSGLRSLTTGPFNDWDPHWGAQGIVFSSNRDGSGIWKIHMIQPDGSGLRKLSDVPAHDPVLLADGKVVFTDETSSDRAVSGLSLLNPATGARSPVVDIQGFHVGVDIRPGKAPNQVNPRSAGRLLVSILSSRTFDATTSVLRETLTFGRTGREPSLSHCAKPYKDVNGDGLPDLSCRFVTRLAGFQRGDTIGVLRFVDSLGRPREGRDSIVTADQDDPDD